METKERTFGYLFPLCTCVFLGCLTVGISLGTLPAFVHGTLHLNNLLVGVVIGIESAATLAFRHFSGTLCDNRGSRLAVHYGCLLSALSGLGYLLANSFSAQPLTSLAILLLGRILLGLGESLLITGALAWGIGLLGHHRSGKVMAWVGIAIYGAIACGAPLGIFIRNQVGMAAAFASVAVFPLLGRLAIGSLKTLLPTATGNKRIPFYAVMRTVGIPGAGLALATVGFGGLASFGSLFFAQKNWPGAPMALALFGAAYILVRLFLAHLPDRLGGGRVALVSLLTEAAGQIMIWTASSPAQALAGSALTGLGFSLVFPSFGVEAVKRLSPENRGVALGAYVAFFDLALGLTAPLAGWIAGRWGYAAIYCFGAISAGVSVLLALSLRKRVGSSRSQKFAQQPSYD
jgi:MFS family permease